MLVEAASLEVVIEVIIKVGIVIEISKLNRFVGQSYALRLA